MSQCVMGEGRKGTSGEPMRGGRGQEGSAVRRGREDRSCRARFRTSMSLTQVESASRTQRNRHPVPLPHSPRIARAPATPHAPSLSRATTHECSLTRLRSLTKHHTPHTTHAHANVDTCTCTRGLDRHPETESERSIPLARRGGPSTGRAGVVCLHSTHSECERKGAGRVEPTTHTHLIVPLPDPDSYT